MSKRMTAAEVCPSRYPLPLSDQPISEQTAALVDEDELAAAGSPEINARMSASLTGRPVLAMAFLEAARQIQRIAQASKTLGIPEKTLRDIRFYSADRFAADGAVLPGNGFNRAFLKLGRSVYIDIPAFIDIWRAQQSKGASHG